MDDHFAQAIKLHTRINAKYTHTHTHTEDYREFVFESVEPEQPSNIGPLLFERPHIPNDLLLKNFPQFRVIEYLLEYFKARPLHLAKPSLKPSELIGRLSSFYFIEIEMHRQREDNL